jgi:hypothetical protein
MARTGAPERNADSHGHRKRVRPPAQRRRPLVCGQSVREILNQSDPWTSARESGQSQHSPRGGPGLRVATHAPSCGRRLPKFRGSVSRRRVDGPRPTPRACRAADASGAILGRFPAPPEIARVEVRAPTSKPPRTIRTNRDIPGTEAVSRLVRLLRRTRVPVGRPAGNFGDARPANRTFPACWELGGMN